jgi:hypothetical protein
MFELVFGALLGTVGSLIISHFYYRKSSQEMDALINSLQLKIEELAEIARVLEKSVSVVLDETGVIKKITVMGTPDDPNYPYK